MHFNIILPTLGRDSLSAAVDTVLNQSHKEWTLYVMGDNIEVQDFDDERIICENTGEDSGEDYGAFARNYAIAVTIKVEEPEWIAYIDDDDEWLPNHLETLAKMIEENPGVNMARTAGQSFMMKHKSPRSSKLVRKMGVINSTDYLAVGMAHTSEAMKGTGHWQSCDNHDNILWREMLSVGGVSIESDAVTFHFKR